MRKLLFTFAVLLTLAACNKQTAGYTITGTAEGTQDGDTVYLCEMQGFFGLNPLDSTYVKNGKFEFKGESEGAMLRFLVPLHGGQPTAMAMFILENEAIRATIKPEGKESVFEGGPNQKLYDEYTKEANRISQLMEEPWQTVNDANADEATRHAAQQVLDSLRNAQKNYNKEFIIGHVPSAISDMLFAFCRQDFDEDDQEEILKLFGEKQPDFPYYKAIMTEREASKASKVGTQYTDFTMDSPGGKPVKISDYVGKNRLTLIDFWASWCGPCRAEMPNVVKTYDAFHKQGFEVVGVSLDNKKEAWVTAIDQLKMPWPQMSDLKGWECEGAKIYNIRSIPANLLVDKSGKIVAKDLRGDALYDKVGELLK